MYYEILELTLDFGYDDISEETEDVIYNSVLWCKWEAHNENELKRIIEEECGYKVIHVVAKLADNK